MSLAANIEANETHSKLRW